MYIDRILYPIQSLGPGKRIVLWTQGCSHHCFNCANPELWETTSSKWVDADALASAVISQFSMLEIDGLTITGGDPMEQADELLSFLSAVRKYVPDVLVYTGFTFQQLAEFLSETQMEKARTLIDVLIDGPYIHDKNDNMISLRGSTNQAIHFWNPAVKECYESYMQQYGRMIQNVYYDESLISVGIHNKERKT